MLTPSVVFAQHLVERSEPARPHSEAKTAKTAKSTNSVQKSDGSVAKASHKKKVRAQRLKSFRLLRDPSTAARRTVNGFIRQRFYGHGRAECAQTEVHERTKNSSTPLAVPAKGLCSEVPGSCVSVRSVSVDVYRYVVGVGMQTSNASLGWRCMLYVVCCTLYVVYVGMRYADFECFST